jgi:hypothetical protein
MIHPVVIWEDPGGMTGLAWLLHGHDFSCDEYSFLEACEQVEQYCRYYQGSLAIGWETYHIRTHLPQTHAHTALEMIGATRYLATKYRCHILPHAEPHKPTTEDKRLLKAVGWWVPGKDDAQSAACHMLKYLMRTGNLPPREAALLSEVTA